MPRLHNLATKNDVSGVKDILQRIVTGAREPAQGKEAAFRATVQRDGFGCPPLLWCAVFGHIETAKELLRAMGLWKPGFHAALCRSGDQRSPGERHSRRVPRAHQRKL